MKITGMKTHILAIDSTPWYGGAVALIIIIGLFTNLRRGGS